MERPLTITTSSSTNSKICHAPDRMTKWPVATGSGKIGFYCFLVMVNVASAISRDPVLKNKLYNFLFMFVIFIISKGGRILADSLFSVVNLGAGSNNTDTRLNAWL